MSDLGQIRAKREAAARARRLALQLTSEEDRTRALAFAAELDAEAAALERANAPDGSSAGPPVVPRPGVTQMQMQVQQGPPAQDEEARKDDSDKDGDQKEES